ncbi:unnamed protein product [Schistosoma margrebowiei]|uniref:Uncharacterized protein n=1 Tax=Schistosoma margrebowiei TaxID=48269 RepID=A0A183MCG2_9TREM|nr:unnamed protein product [Schistosoma margrebowiei]
MSLKLYFNKLRLLTINFKELNYIKKNQDVYIGECYST